MGLEDVLRQNNEIREFLTQLAAMHGRALEEQQLSSQLDKIRRDILVCFNDLCRLNEMLISCDGEIREEIANLKKAKTKLGKLGQREGRLKTEKEKWAINNDPEIAVDKAAPNYININSSYRPVMEQYLELVGAQNTSLAQELADPDGQEEDPKKTLESVKLLETCNQLCSKDIRQLEQLVKNFIKDRHFIEKELKMQNAKIRRKTSHFDEELERVKQSREKLFVKVGLISSEFQESTLASKFFNLSFHRSKGERLESEVSDITDHAIEFIDMKILSLQDQLTHKKEDSSNLANQRNLWNDCVRCVRDLEDHLGLALSDDEAFAESLLQIKHWLKEACVYLGELASAADTDMLVKLIEEEKNVIEKAYQELPKETKQKVLTQDNKIRSSSPLKQHTSPPFAILGKSPPKIGISEQTVEYASSDNVYELNNMSAIKKKFQKKD